MLDNGLLRRVRPFVVDGDREIRQFLMREIDARRLLLLRRAGNLLFLKFKKTTKIERTFLDVRVV